jgi:autotransporter-associated beta strand protein
LTGTGTATIDWDIQDGTLQVGNGGNGGPVLGNIANNATLAFNRSDTLAFGGVISGSGAVNQIGSGTTVLTAANTYTGGTTISGGTLQVSSDGNLGDAAGGLTLAGGTLKTTPMGTGDSLMGRVGVAADYQDVLRVSVGKVLHRASLYGIANLYYELLDGTGVKVAGIEVRSADNRAAAGAGAGASYSWANDAYSVYGEVVAKTSLRNFGDSYDYTGTVGFRVKF